MKQIKKVAIVSAAAVLAAISMATMAYFTDKDDAKNQFTVGINTIDISEPTYSETSEPYSEGDKFLKDPTVVCPSIVNDNGDEINVDCYVRCYCEFDNTMAEDYVSMNFNTTEWTEKQPDGYYYYTKVLSPGEKTTPLFTEVQIADSDDHTYDIDDFDIIVYAESCQAVNAETGANYASYEDAWAYWNTPKEALD